jgi:hypothetical protein
MNHLVRNPVWTVVAWGRSHEAPAAVGREPRDHMRSEYSVLVTCGTSVPRPRTKVGTRLVLDEVARLVRVTCPVTIKGSPEGGRCGERSL